MNSPIRRLSEVADDYYRSGSKPRRLFN